MANDRLGEVLLVHMKWLCVISRAISTFLFLLDFVFGMNVHKLPGDGVLRLAH